MRRLQWRQGHSLDRLCLIGEDEILWTNACSERASSLGIDRDLTKQISDLIDLAVGVEAVGKHHLVKLLDDLLQVFAASTPSRPLQAQNLV